MKFYTHLAFGFLMGLIFLIILRPGNQILFMGLCLIGSACPDIDHPKSKLGQWFKPIGWLFEHRGFFHSIFPLMILFLLSKLNPLFIPFLIGYASHILIDMTTKQGILFIHPFINIRISGFIRTGSILETIIFLGISLANLILILKL